ncbi:MAG TPA: SHOCT domain-containing protein [Lysobacter sp.]
MSDPVDSLVTVEFVDGVVVNARQVPAPGSDVQPSELVKAGAAPSQVSVGDRLKQLQKLLDDKLISQEEFEVKRKALIDAL